LKQSQLYNTAVQHLKHSYTKSLKTDGFTLRPSKVTTYHVALIQKKVAATA